VGRVLNPSHDGATGFKPVPPFQIRATVTGFKPVPRCGLACNMPLNGRMVLVSHPHMYQIPDLRGNSGLFWMKSGGARLRPGDHFRQKGGLLLATMGRNTHSGPVHFLLIESDYGTRG
jgi:hypothetical protein